MKTVKVIHYVKISVSISKPELTLLIHRAKMHYDYKCRAAAGYISPQFAKNGFLAIAEMKIFTFKEAEIIWGFEEFDTCLKILEIAPSSKSILLTRSFLHRCIDVINSKQNSLNA